MSERKTKPRPNRRMIQIRRDDHDALKALASVAQPFAVPLQTVVTAARLAIQSLPESSQLQFLKRAAEADAYPSAPAMQPQ